MTTPEIISLSVFAGLCLACLAIGVGYISAVLTKEQRENKAYREKGTLPKNWGKVNGEDF